MKKLLSKKPAVALIAVLVIVVGYLLFGRGSSGNAESLTIAPHEFVQQVSVSGKVIASQNVELGFAESGRVAHVYASVGLQVGSGALLAEIENGDIRASLLQKEAYLESQQARLESLKKGARPEEVAVAESAVARDRTSESEAKLAVVNAVRDAYVKADDAVHNTVDQFMRNTRSPNPELVFSTTASQVANQISSRRATIEFVLAKWQAEALNATQDGDVEALAKSANEKLVNVAFLLADASAALSQSLPSQTYTESILHGYAGDVATARTIINTSISTVSGAVANLRDASASLDASIKNLALKKAASSISDINAQISQVRASEAEVLNTQAQLLRTQIISPFSGLVTKMDLKKGEIVSPNVPKVSLMSTGAFQIESYVPEVAIANIKIGDSATATLDAYGESTLFAAKVVGVDPAETVRDGVSTYKTVLEFDIKDDRIKSGMTANVLITTAHKQAVLSVPQGVVTSRGSDRFVTVLVKNKPVERQVVTGGVSSAGEIEILNGLKAGEIVVLKSVTK